MMNWLYRFDRFQFNDDTITYQNIDAVFVFDSQPLIVDRE